MKKRGIVSSFGSIFLILSLCLMCLTVMYSIDRHKPRTQHGKGEKQRDIRTKKEKKSHPWVNCFHHKKEKEKKEGKEEGWREWKMEILFWFSSFMNTKLYLSHLDVTSSHGFILHVDYCFLSFWFVLICYM